MPDPTLDIQGDPEALAIHVADWLAERARAASGPFRVCLSGGSTPKRLYQLLAERHAGDFPWDRTHWFFGDERFVPHEDEQSNFHMVTQALFKRAPVPGGNIHGIRGTGDPETAARAYETVLRQAYGTDTIDPSRPLFDVNFLGIGPDGHTASLFPGAPSLAETGRWALPVETATQAVTRRITLTLPVLNSARVAAFLAAGKEKAEMVKRVRDRDQSLPAAHIQPSGDLVFFLDRAAAGQS